jgi:hypothetical protein
VTPAIKLGIISLVVLTPAIVTRYVLHLAWRKTYVIAACAALYFNVFVPVVQSFEKIPPLKAAAPPKKNFRERCKHPERQGNLERNGRRKWIRSANEGGSSRHIKQADYKNV